MAEGRFVNSKLHLILSQCTPTSLTLCCSLCCDHLLGSAFYSPLSSAQSSKTSPASVLTLHRLPQQPFPQQPLPPALIAEQLGHSIWKRDKTEFILHKRVCLCVCVELCGYTHTFAFKYWVFMVHILTSVTCTCVNYL